MAGNFGGIQTACGGFAEKRLVTLSYIAAVGSGTWHSAVMKKMKNLQANFSWKVNLGMKVWIYI